MDTSILPQTKESGLTRWYQSDRRENTPSGMAYCSDCDTYQDQSRFSKDKNKRSGFKSTCKDCDKLRYTPYYASTKDKSSARMRKRNLNHYFGINEVEYREMLEAQGGLCAICGKVETQIAKGVLCPLSVDHDHETGKIRGLLCSACNRGLGSFRDSMENLSNAIDYLMGTHE